MAKLTIGFGLALMVLGAAAFAVTHFSHSFIPMGFGLLLALLGGLANTEDAKKRMIAMHIAVTVGLLGFLGTIPGFIGLIQLAAGKTIARSPKAATVQALMGTICLVFVLLCVRSFIAARRARTV